MYGLRDGSLAAVKGFGELTPDDGADAWAAALLHLRAAMIETLGTEQALNLLADVDTMASFCCERLLGDSRDQADATSRLRDAASRTSEVGYRDTLAYLARTEFYGRTVTDAG